MSGFWTSSSSSPSQQGNCVENISVKSSPIPAKAPSTLFRTEGSNNLNDSQEGSKGTSNPIETPRSDIDTGTNSPRVERSPLPRLPFIPSPEQNPGLTGYPRYRADPSSILLSYPRSNIDRTHDFYGIYNPPTKGPWTIGSVMVMCGVATVSKTFMTFGAYTGVYNLNPFLKILYDQHRTRPILTVTNHTSTADDPLLWGALPWKCYLNPSNHIRYALGAQELCYPNKPTAAFFRFGQIVPIIRGNGIYQPAIDRSIDLLRSGKWVHIFPEGKINQSDQLIRLKWGVGRIIMEYGGLPIAKGGKPMEQTEMPIIIPIYHLGMEDILRLYPNNDSPIIPKFGMPLTIVFGDPIDFTSLMQEYKEGKLQETEARIKITERVFDSLEELRQIALKLHKEQIDRAEQDRIKKGMWWWVIPTGWGWWNTKDIHLNIRNRDNTVKIEEI
ncbi:hypothetical protein BGZ76_001340 [Entomortierella beljakovae]|nr:hypothetical protein BGZ76_001340 [Entomortierella beljakovae]